MTSSDTEFLNKKCLKQRNDVETKDELPRPSPHGARIKVCCAGVDYLEIPRGNETSDTSSHSWNPVFEIAGIVDEINDSAQQRFRNGDKVIVFVRKEIPRILTEYVLVNDVGDLIAMPDSLPMDLAAILPYGALRAYSAVVRAKVLAEARMKPSGNLANVLIVGPGNLNLWALKFFNCLVADRSKFRLVVGDTNVRQLVVSKDQGCQAVINWNDTIHHDYIRSRTKQAFLNQGIDLAIDFISSVQTVSHIMTLLREEGAILVSDNSLEEMPISLTHLSKNNINIVGMNNGSTDQLESLLHLISSAKVTPIPYSVYPAEEKAKVFELVKHGALTSRAVLQFSIAPTDLETRSSHPELFI